jgi:hypothetical protein
LQLNPSATPRAGLGSGADVVFDLVALGIHAIGRIVAER